jgi:hypothetical protein
MFKRATDNDLHFILNKSVMKYPYQAVVVVVLFLYVLFWIAMVPTPTAVESEHINQPKARTKTWQPKSRTVPCPGQLETLKKEIFKSQAGEDKKLMTWFGQLCNGTYLEMGALDGVLFSNTHAFHFGLGWKGLLLDASPRNFEELKRNRPNELALVHAGVCYGTNDLHWVEGRDGATGGFLEFATEEHKKRFFPKESIANSQAVQCQPLGDTLREKLGDYIFFDFYSLDIEGAELDALATLDFDKVSFGMIFVESNGQNSLKDMAIRTLLESNGYVFLSTNTESGHLASAWFVNKDWHSIYRDQMYH